MSGENLPTETAAKFAAATSRDSARKLLGGIFSLDRFQYVLRFCISHLGGGRPQRSAFPAQGAKHTYLTLDLAPDDTFKFNHDAVLERWKMYGES
ncbi:hypothetical protein E4U37_002056 [Claviceps purpurea]|nr:hypothetical protein E4U37_002056 [Claviceps purpurea]